MMVKDQSFEMVKLPESGVITKIMPVNDEVIDSWKSTSNNFFWHLLCPQHNNVFTS